MAAVSWGVPGSGLSVKSNRKFSKHPCLEAMPFQISGDRMTQTHVRFLVPRNPQIPENNTSLVFVSVPGTAPALLKRACPLPAPGWFEPTAGRRASPGKGSRYIPPGRPLVPMIR